MGFYLKVPEEFTRSSEIITLEHAHPLSALDFNTSKHLSTQVYTNFIPIPVYTGSGLLVRQDFRQK